MMADVDPAISTPELEIVKVEKVQQPFFNQFCSNISLMLLGVGFANICTHTSLVIPTMGDIVASFAGAVFFAILSCNPFTKGGDE